MMITAIHYAYFRAATSAASLGRSVAMPHAGHTKRLEDDIITIDAERDTAADIDYNRTAEAFRCAGNAQARR